MKSKTNLLCDPQWYQRVNLVSSATLRPWPHRLSTCRVEAGVAGRMAEAAGVGVGENNGRKEEKDLQV